MSPTRKHARLQTEIAVRLNAWSHGRGEVGTEWRFRVAPPGELRRPLVPDVSFVAKERLDGLSDDDIEMPAFAPTVAVEILSPGDKRKDVASKIDVYLRAGAELVVVVDPLSRKVVLHDGHEARTLSTTDTLEHPALPGFILNIGDLFSIALERS
jgi:Uma2 family endonuclease